MGVPLVVGISGATGAVYGVEVLRALGRLGQPCHLIVTRWGARTLMAETGIAVAEIGALAEAVHDNDNLAAAVASGSFQTRGMVIAPCSIKTLAGIAAGYADTLLVRAADVTLKERRPLVLMVRETPLHKGHLELMARAAGLGAVILPPVPAFYNRPRTIDDLVRHTVGRALDLVGVEHDLLDRWRGA